jgi:excisionase family DNA binding protein
MTSLNPLTSSSNDRLVYTITEAAQLLGISRALAYELAARGDIPVIRFGRRLVDPKAQLVAMLDPPTRVNKA